MDRIIGYWKCRGVAQSIRYMLAYKNLEFKEDFYDSGSYNFNLPHHVRINCRCNPVCDNHRQETIIPYYRDEDGTVFLGARDIIDEICLRHDLMGTNSVEHDRINIVEEQAEKWRKEWDRLIYGSRSDFDLRKTDYYPKLWKYLQFMTKFLETESWFAGITLTYVDFIVYELLDINQRLCGDCLAPYPNLASFKQRVEDLTNIKNYIQSDLFLKDIMNRESGCFGRDPDIDEHLEFADFD